MIPTTKRPRYYCTANTPAKKDRFVEGKEYLYYIMPNTNIGELYVVIEVDSSAQMGVYNKEEFLRRYTIPRKPRRYQDMKTTILAICLLITAGFATQTLAQETFGHKESIQWHNGAAVANGDGRLRLEEMSQYDAYVDATESSYIQTNYSGYIHVRHALLDKHLRSTLFVQKLTTEAKMEMQRTTANKLIYSWFIKVKRIERIKLDKSYGPHKYMYVAYYTHDGSGGGDPGFTQRWIFLNKSAFVKFEGSHYLPAFMVNRKTSYNPATQQIEVYHDDWYEKKDIINMNHVYMFKTKAQ